MARRLSSSVETIGSNAFEGLWLTFLIPDDSHLKSIGEKAFLGVKFANNVVYLSDYAKELQLPEGLEEIGSEAFNMAQLKVLSIPASVNKLGDNICDRACTQLKVVTDSYAAQYATENGYTIFNSGGEDTSWLNS